MERFFLSFFIIVNWTHTWLAQGFVLFTTFLKYEKKMWVKVFAIFFLKATIVNLLWEKKRLKAPRWSKKPKFVQTLQIKLKMTWVQQNWAYHEQLLIAANEFSNQFCQETLHPQFLFETQRNASIWIVKSGEERPDCLSLKILSFHVRQMNQAHLF